MRKGDSKEGWEGGEEGRVGGGKGKERCEGGNRGRVWGGQGRNFKVTDLVVKKKK